MKAYYSTQKDANDAVRLLLDFHKASKLPFDTSAAWALALFNSCVNDSNKVAISKEGGILLAMCGKSLLGPFVQSSEIAWWVNPDKRGNSLDMIKLYEEWAISKEVKFIEVKSLNIFRETERLYEKLGYEPTETSWIKVIK